MEDGLLCTLSARSSGAAAFQGQTCSSETTCFRSSAVSSTRERAVISTRCAHWSLAIVLACPAVSANQVGMN